MREQTPKQHFSWKNQLPYVSGQLRACNLGRGLGHTARAAAAAAKPAAPALSGAAAARMQQQYAT